MRSKLIGAAAAVVAALAVSAPAASANHARGIDAYYNVTLARMSYTVDFTGAGAAGCANYGVCDVSGTAAYSFRLTDFGFAFFEFTRRPRRATGEFFLFGQGTTRARSGAATDPTPCQATARRSADRLSASGRNGRIKLTLHPYYRDGSTADYLDTICAGPGDAALRRAGVMPSMTFRARTLRHRTVRLRASGTRPFEAHGFRGTVRYSVRFTLRRENVGSEGAAEPRFTG